MCMTGGTDGKKLSKKPCELVPDTESFIIRLDNQVTCCIERNINNFVTKLTSTPNIRVRGVGNQLIPARVMGAVLWKIEDDSGVTHDILYPGTLYIPELEMCLMSPQSWCQSANDNFPKKHGTWQYQTAESFVMEWNQRKFRRIFTWDRRTNTGRLRSSPGTKHCHAFAECIKHEHIAYEAAHVIPDDHMESSCDCSQSKSTLGA
jgi:hypothetical protein